MDLGHYHLWVGWRRTLVEYPAPYCLSRADCEGAFPHRVHFPLHRHVRVQRKALNSWTDQRTHQGRGEGVSKGGLHPLIPDRYTGVNGSNPGPVEGLLASLDVRLRHATLNVEGCGHIEDASVHSTRGNSDLAFAPQAGVIAQNHRWILY